MVIRMRHNRSQTRQRRSHHGLKSPTLVVCDNCNEMRRPHHMCLSCGFYKGRQVLNLTEAKAKREARLAAKREQISADAESEQPVAEEPTPAVAEETKDEEKK